jgi:hypothetical protein
MILNTILLAATALLFVVVFGGLTAFYIRGTEAVPNWFWRLRLLPPKPISQFTQAIGLATSLVFIGLAQWAVAANLDPAEPLRTAILLGEEIAAVLWLAYLGRRLLRFRVT